MGNQVYILPYLRKGLINNITNGSTNVGKAKRAEVNVDLLLKIKDVKTGQDESKKYSGQKIELLGPADVRSISPKAIMHVSPAESGDVRLNASYRPYIEFYEEDLPWRYTPYAPENPNFFPWMRLIAVKKDECFICFRNGVKVARLNLSKERIDEVFSTRVALSKSAHVQIDVDDNFNGNFDNNKVNELLNENPDCGISRILCTSPLEKSMEYFILLIPTYEHGRLAALGQSLNNTDMSTLVRPQANTDIDIPIYYKWTCTTAAEEGTFKKLADKLNCTEDYKNMEANLTVDITQSGLPNFRYDKEKIIDVPAALVMNEKPYENIEEEDKKRQTVPKYRDALKEHLMLNPVFDENELGTIDPDHDPFVVPPVYGARHLMTKRKDFDKGVNGNVVNDVNLKLQNRIPAGMGASVIKEHQEDFVNRAWKKVEVVNALNQMLREYYQMNHVNECAEDKNAGKNTRSGKNRDKLNKQNEGLVTDAALRMLQSSGIYYNNVNPDKMLEAYKSELKESALVSAGISANYLKDVFNKDSWEKLVLEDYMYDCAVDIFKNNDAWAGVLSDVDFLQQMFETTTINNKKAQFVPKDGVTFSAPQKSILTSSVWDSIVAAIKATADPIDMESAYSALSNLKDSYETFNEACLGSSIGQITYRDEVNSKEEISSIRPYPVNVKNTNGSTLIVPTEVYEKIKIGNEFLGTAPLAIEYYKKGKPYTPLYLFLVPKSYLDKKSTKVKYYVTAKERNVQVNLGSNGLYEPTGNNSCIANYFWDNNGKSQFDPENSQLFKQLKENYNWMKDRTGKYYYLENAKKNQKSNSKHDKPAFQFKYNDKEFDTSLSGRYCWLRWSWQGKGKTFATFTASNKCWTVQIGQYISVIKEMLNGISSLKMLMFQPTDVEVDISVKDCRLVTADEYFQKAAKNIEADITIEKENPLNDIIVKVEGTSKDINDNLKLNDSSKIETVSEPTTIVSIDPEALGKERIETIISKYGVTEYTQLEGRLHGKYPVMIHPDYLDPTFFYLRELSVDYVLPAAGSLAKNSISCFYSNPVFEESFLMGMNTEMGRELMWREYPTDQRGSYFRKFWDQPNLPVKDKLEKEYYDIIDIDKWKKPLGENHTEGKKAMLVFAIKGELMQTFPDTEVYLQEKVKNLPKGIIKKAEMTSWLTSDTYLVGFSGVNKENLKKYYLAFEQKPMSLQFEWDGVNEKFVIVNRQRYLMEAMN